MLVSGTELEQCSIKLQKPVLVKILTPDGMTHAPECVVEFIVPISGAAF